MNTLPTTNRLTALGIVLVLIGVVVARPLLTTTSIRETATQQAHRPERSDGSSKGPAEEPTSTPLPGPTASSHAAGQPETTGRNPRAPRPGAPNGPGHPDPSPGPDDSHPGKGGRLREVDVAHVDELVGAAPAGVVVTVAGTGAVHTVSSWSVDAAHQPHHLATTDPLPGVDVRVHAPQPTLDSRVFLTAARRDDGNLWLTSWTVTPDGTLTQLDTRGYGANAGVNVEEYAIAGHPVRRDGRIDHYEIATPVRVTPAHRSSDPAITARRTDTGPSMRVVTWSVDPVSGVIQGLADSEDFGDPAAPSHPTIAPLTNTSYEVSYRGATGDLANHTVRVVAGAPSLLGSGISGLDLHGQNPVTEALQDGAVGPLNDVGFVTALRDAADELRVVVWENRVTACDGPCYVTPHRVTDSIGDAKPGTFGLGLPEPDVLASHAALYDTSASDTVTDAGILHETLPPGLPGAGLGSMTKVMVLLLALEAVSAGEVSLDDLVLVPATEQAQWVVAGDEVSLRALLHGMMKRSSNGAAIAVGHHLAQKVYGIDDIYDLSLDEAKDEIGEFMTARAAELDLDDTIYCQPQGSGFSTPRDQIDLWLTASQHPMFWTFAGVGTYENFDPAFDANGDPKAIAPVNKGDWDRIDIDGHKDGVLSGNTMGYVEEDGQQVLSCDALEESSSERACGFCRIVQATRLGRSLIVESQVSTTKSDSVDTLLGLIDWGFQTIFTPDNTGSSDDADKVADFGLTSISDTVAVTATVRKGSGELEVCTREVVVWVSGAVSPLACEELTIEGLAPGTGPVVTNGTEIVRLSTLEAEGDYLTGHLVDGHLRLTAWRVGSRPGWL